MSIRDCIIMQSQELTEPGTSTRIQCPYCLDNEDTMSLTLEEGFVLYNCFRAGCGQKGRINIPGIFQALKEETISKQCTDVHSHEKMALYNRAMDWHIEGVYNFPYKLFPEYPNISTDMMMLSGTTYYWTKDVFVTELENQEGYMCKRGGALGAQLLGGKSRNYLQSNATNVGKELYSNPLSSVFICEDIISGMWIRQVTKRNTFVLFGTNVTNSMYDLTLSEYDSWVWCLDNDTNYGASQKYRQIRDTYPLHDHRFIVLDKDPKAHTENELLKALHLEQYE